MDNDAISAVIFIFGFAAVVFGAPTLLLIAWRAQRMLAGREYPQSGFINRTARRWAEASKRNREWLERSKKQQSSRDYKTAKPNIVILPSSAKLKASEPIRIRVAAKTENGGWRQVKIVGNRISCDCAGFKDGICSHIDAVIIAGETAMVHAADRELAQIHSKRLSGTVAIPARWQASWKRELRWRGLSDQPKPIRRYVRASQKPLVAFTGCKNRTVMIAEARKNGWDVTDEPSAYLDVLVAANPAGNSNKIKAARASQVPIVQELDWPEIMMTGEIPD